MLLFIFSFFVLFYISSSTSVFIIEEDDQTLSFPIQRGVVDHLENGILDILGIDEPPSSTNSLVDSTSEYMKRLYSSFEHIDETDEKVDDDTYNAEMIIAVNPKDRISLDDSSMWRILFESDTISSQGELMSAIIHFSFSQSLEKILKKIELFTQLDGQLTLVDVWNVPIDGSKDIHFNITSLVSSWPYSSSPAELLVSIDRDGDSIIRANDWNTFIVGSLHSIHPFIGKERRSNRKKRSIPPSSPHMNESIKPNPFKKRGSKATCRKHGLYIDFKELGWGSWIISPPGFDAHYCYGRCSFPLSNSVNASNHAIVQTLVNLVHPKRANEAVCVPSNMANLLVLYKDNNNSVILKHYQSMIVKSCGCQ